MLRRAYVTVFCIMGLIAASGQTASERLERANDAYAEKDFDRAIEAYETLLKEGFRSEALYYNLGNAYFRTGDRGRAALNYERALLVDPGDREARGNLEIIRSRLPDAFRPVPEFFLKRWWRQAFQLAGPSFWAAAGIVLWWLGAAGLVVWLLAARRIDRKRGFFAGLILIGLSALPFALAAGRYQYETDNNYAVVIDAEAPLHRGADEESEQLDVLPAGVKVALIDVIGDWHKVRVVNGEEGWLPAEAFERI